MKETQSKFSRITNALRNQTTTRRSLSTKRNYYEKLASGVFFIGGIEFEDELMAVEDVTKNIINYAMKEGIDIWNMSVWRLRNIPKFGNRRFFTKQSK